MDVYELITCVQRANENAGNVISVVQFLINIDISDISKFDIISLKSEFLSTVLGHHKYLS